MRSELPNVQSFYELGTKNAYNVGANQTEWLLLVHVECTKTCWFISVTKGGQTPVFERFKVVLLSRIRIIPRAWKLFRVFSCCASDGAFTIISYCDEGLLPLSIQTFQHKKIKAFSTFKGQTIQLVCLTLEMELIGCPETSETNNRSTLCNIPEERRLIYTAVQAWNQALSLYPCCILTGHFHWYLVVTYVSWFHPCLYVSGVCSVVQGLATYGTKARNDPRKYQSVPQPYSNSFKGNITRDSKTSEFFFSTLARRCLTCKGL